MGESGGADIRRPDILRDIRQFIHEPRNLAELCEIWHAGETHFDLKCGDDGREVAIPYPLAVAVHRALHLAGSGSHGSEGVGDPQPTIIVSMDADRAFQFRHNLGGDAGDFLRKRTPIRVAEHQHIGPGVAGGTQRVERVFGVVLVAVEKMLGVIENLAAVLFKERHRVGDHREVFIRRHIQNLRDMEQPGLADDRHDRRLRIEKQFHLRIRFDRHTTSARAAEGGDLRIFPFQFRRLAEKRRVAWVRARPTTFDVIHTKRIKPLGDANLVEDRKRNSRALRAVAQCGVVDRDRFHEWAETLCPRRGRIKNAGTPSLTFPLWKTHDPSLENLLLVRLGH